MKLIISLVTRRLNRHYFFFFGSQVFFNQADVAVGNVLHLFFRIFGQILAQPVFLQLFYLFNGIATDAPDGDAGLREMRNHTPDLILTDLSMVPTDGIEFTRQVRTSQASPNPYVPIIMVTGHTERPRVEAARDAGVTEFLAKPITVNNLIARLAEIVERPRPFVKCETYFGPDRRRRKNKEFTGPWRRHDDTSEGVEIR